jgi:hypothetical protein
MSINDDLWGAFDHLSSAVIEQVQMLTKAGLARFLRIWGNQRGNRCP